MSFGRKEKNVTVKEDGVKRKMKRERERGELEDKGRNSMRLTRSSWKTKSHTSF
jgi:hypothetical protein